MRCYKIVVPEDVAEADKPTVAWAGTQADARAAKKGLAHDHGLPETTRKIEVNEVDVPTDKQGLLKFLQDNVKA